MSQGILLTSFTTWLPHQLSNSSDDLLNLISLRKSQHKYFTFLQNLPVDINLASYTVLNRLETFNFNCIICCGMAEKRHKLTVESNARFKEQVIQTTVDLNQLINNLVKTEISHDAGKFVCEGLYYSVLKYIRERGLKTRCIFVHVPILNKNNTDDIVNDFLLISQRLAL